MRNIAIAAFVGLVIGAVATYFGRPAEVREVQVEKVVVKEVARAASNVVTKRVVEKKPDGHTTTTETIIDKSVTETAKVEESSKFKETTKKTLAPSWQAQGGAGLDTNGNRLFLVGLQKQFLGPFSLGVVVTGQPDKSYGAAFATISFKF